MKEGEGSGAMIDVIEIGSDTETDIEGFVSHMLDSITYSS